MYRIKHRFDITRLVQDREAREKSKNRRMYPMVTSANTALLVSIWAHWATKS